VFITTSFIDRDTYYDDLIPLHV